MLTTPHVAPGTPTATGEEVAKPGAKSNRTFGTEVQAPYQGLRSHMLCNVAKQTEKNKAKQKTKKPLKYQMLART